MKASLTFLGLLVSLVAACALIYSGTTPVGSTLVPASTTSAIASIITLTPFRPVTLTPTATRSPTPTMTATPEMLVTPVDQLKPLKKFARARGRQIGTLISMEALEADPNYRSRLLEQFDSATISGIYWTHKGPNRFDFSNTDPLVDFAFENRLIIRGQSLVFHGLMPDWIEKEERTKAQAEQILHEYISTVVGHYRGKVNAWVVVNEAINADGTLRNTYWLRTIGPDYIEKSFAWAHKADPEALLIYNDYHMERYEAKQQAVFELVKDFTSRGVPIHGVGFQLHFELGSVPPGERLESRMKPFSDIGLLVYITELDVMLKEPASADHLKQQAEIYARVMNACLRVPNCLHFSTWGFTDKYSWIPRHFPGYGSALLFDENYRPKPAYYQLLDSLRTGQP